MKKFLLATIAVLFSASAARADFYLSAGAGLNINDSDLKTFTDKDLYLLMKQIEFYIFGLVSF